MEVSASLKLANAGGGGREWLSACATKIAVVTAALRIMHPELYKTGMAAMENLAAQSGDVRDPADLLEVLTVWPTVFNACSVISDRSCPFHRDNFSRPEWFDMMVTTGPYERAVMELPTVGLRLRYDSGTIVGLCGKVLTHGVSEHTGQRLSLTFYMRDNVHERVGTRACSWMEYSTY